MNRSYALELLQLNEHYPDPESIKQAYRLRCKAVHPDSLNFEQGINAAEALSALALARDYLLYFKDSTCNLCKGMGKVRGRVGAQTCTACHGTGEKL